MKLVSVKQMIALEKEADKSGLTYAQMMANAGRGLALVVHQRYFDRKNNRVLGLVGSGNNGGDTLVALKHLAGWGWQTKAYLVKQRKQNDELLFDYLNAGGEAFSAEDDKNLAKLTKLALDCDCILDGILGTGIKLPLRGKVKEALSLLNEINGLPPVAAVDCPSGVDCDSGQASEACLRAELTVCMVGVKQGLLKQPALDISGEITIVDIGLPDDLSAWKGIDTEVIDAQWTADHLPVRPADGHKGTFGTCMLIAGSINYCGAVLLASRAAYRVGAGLVRAAIPGAIYDAVAGQLPDATWLILPHTLGVINEEGVKIVTENMERIDCILAGSGWGLEPETLSFLQKLLKTATVKTKQDPFGLEVNEGKSSFDDIHPLPGMVIDADGLKLLAKITGWEKKLEKTAVLTPHPGEMADLTGLPVKDIQAKRVEVASRYAQQWGHVVVLKGALTVVAAPDGRKAIIPVANSALAVAGSGDVLAGMVCGLITQGMDAYDAAAAGAWLHAQAGLAALEVLGNPASVMASDIIWGIAPVLSKTGGC
jgi:NAD(P)H-hydrate epimerase